MVQVDLFYGESIADRKFREFHEKNPWVYKELVALAWQAHERGRKRIGIKMLIEVVRWARTLQTRGDVYKINNNYAPRYARKIMEEYPELDGLFNLRDLRT